MEPIEAGKSLTQKVYDAILDEILEGRLSPGTHLKQQQLAEQLGVSRQPVQQALALLKSDGLIEDAGKRGLQVTSIDASAMRQHYAIRGALDALAALECARRVAASPNLASQLERKGFEILRAGHDAVERGGFARQIRHDEAFHVLLYEFSGNPLIQRTAEPHWRFLRRVMAEVLRHAEPPTAIWRQHKEILEAIIAGDLQKSERLAKDHARLAGNMLEQALHAKAGRWSEVQSA